METVNVDYISNDFSGVAVSNGKKYFISDVLEQELIEIVKYKSYKKYNIATKYNLIKKSDSRCEPECEYFNKCGGCSLQYMCD